MSFKKLKQNLAIQYFLIKQQVLSFLSKVSGFLFFVLFKVKTVYELNKAPILFYTGFVLFFTAITLSIYFFLVDQPQVIKGYQKH